MEILLEVCFLEEAEEKAAVTTPQSALHSLQRSRREIRFSTKLPQCFLLNLDIFVFFRPIYLSARLRFFLLDPSPIIESPCLVSSSLFFLRLDWCDPGVWRFMKPLQKSLNQSLPYHLLPVLTAILVTTEQKKHFLVATTKRTQCFWCNICQSHNMELSKLWYGFVKVVTWRF